MKVDKALDEAVLDLVQQLKAERFASERNIYETISRWVSNNFQTMGICAEVSLEAEHFAKEDKNQLRAHYVRAAASKMAIAIASKAAFGEFEIKKPWNNHINHRNIDYHPKFIQHPQMPIRVIQMSFAFLKRSPTSWYQEEDESRWLDFVVRDEPQEKK